MASKPKPWSGRFKEPVDERVKRFTASVDLDRRLAKQDIAGSLAHARMLAAVGIINKRDLTAIERGLAQIRREIEKGGFQWSIDAEDVHLNIERRLTALVGDAGKRLHTARSRNDQVATDLRLWLRAEIDSTLAKLRAAQLALVDLAGHYQEAVLPGYTHLQRAQPVHFAHWCLAYFEMLARDGERLKDARKRVNVMPLGSAALAGTAYQIDREMVARELGFESVSRNSLDAVSDRDFCVEFVAACSLIMLHLSRLAEDIIIYSTVEFGFLELSDAVATGSSIMPQKKNPDSMELVRGKSGRVFGHLSGLLATLKALPLAYNKDMQEDKEALFDATDTVGASLEVAATVLRNMRVREERTRDAASRGYMNATELADYLARKGMPFREAHDVVGRLVLRAIERNVELQDLAFDEMRAFSTLIEEDVYEALSLEKTLATKSQTGGTSPARVVEAISQARAALANSE
jgi:argininosuccinate lyase